MAFIGFMRSWMGRLIRIAAGALLVWYGLTQIVGPSGWLVAAVRDCADRRRIDELLFDRTALRADADGSAIVSPY